MVDACGLQAGHPLRFYWIFYGGLTNAETEVRAVHAPTGRVDVWRNPAGTLPTAEARTNAFPCPEPIRPGAQPVRRGKTGTSGPMTPPRHER